MKEKYESQTKVIGNYFDENGNLKFYEDYMDISSTNDIEIDKKNLKVEYVLKSTMIFRKKEDFEKYMKYHKKVLKFNGFKEIE